MDKSYEERLKLFQEGLAALIKQTDVEPIPTLGVGISAMVATITLIDLKNNDMLAKYGRERIRNADGQPPINPHLN